MTLADTKALCNIFPVFPYYLIFFQTNSNRSLDASLIKILHHYLPAASTSHLYALLKSCKELLGISKQDHKEKELLRYLNQNNLKPTLIYLESKINQNLNKIPLSPALNRQNIIDETVKLCLIFASFSQFYDHKITEKILQMAHLLSPEFFSYWHQIPQKTTAKIYDHLIDKHKLLL